MSEESFIDKILNNGFSRVIYEYEKPPYEANYNQKNGWMGVTKQHPDCEFKKGDKMIVLSYQGILGMNYCHPNDTEWEEEIVQNCSSKIILLLENGNVVYRTMTGVLPSLELQKKFIYS